MQGDLLRGIVNWSGAAQGLVTNSSALCHPRFFSNIFCNYKIRYKIMIKFRGFQTFMRAVATEMPPWLKTKQNPHLVPSRWLDERSL